VSVQRSLLCHYSSYYQAALCGESKEATSSYITTGLDKDCEEFLVHWLYSGRLQEKRPVHDINTEQLFRLYIFADEKDFLALRRTIMNKLVDSGLYELPYPLIALVTNSLPSSAPLYEYVVEWYIRHWHPSLDEDQSYGDVPKEFLHRVMCGIAWIAGFRDRGGVSCPCCADPCRYHEHKSREEWMQSKLTRS
jgi:hypothetical protein